MEPELILEPGLASLLDELRTLEDLYHAAFPDATLADFDRLVAPGFWETGATGRRYSRVFARQVLALLKPYVSPEFLPAFQQLLARHQRD